MAHRLLGWGMVLGVLVCGCGENGPGLFIDPGRMWIQISGTIQHNAEWQAIGEFYDQLDGTENEVSYLDAQNDHPETGDSSLNIFFPARLDAGRWAVGSVAPAGDTVGAAAVLTLAGHTFVSINGGTLDISPGGYPPRPGLEPGVMRGTLTFRGVDYVTADTITVHARFAAHWYHYLHSKVTVALTGGGPLAGHSLFSSAQSGDDTHGGRVVWWDSDFDGVGGGTAPFEITQQLRVVVPELGTGLLSAITPKVLADPTRWPRRFSTLSYRDDPRPALSTGGSVTFTRYLPATESYYGEVAGTLTSRLALWDNDSTASVDTVTTDVTFAIQLWPLGGIPASRFRMASTAAGFSRADKSPSSASPR